MFNHLRKKIVSLMLLVLLATQSVSAIEAHSPNRDNNLTDTQLHAVMGIITNFILSSGSGASDSSGVSDVVVKHTVDNRYKVTWKGNPNAQTWVTYSGSSTVNKISATGNEYIYRHLNPDITFTLYVQGVGSDTLITKVFTTESPVELESTPALEIGSDSVIIKFIANQNAQGQIEYGTSTDYEYTTTKEFSFNYSSHTQTLTNLEAGTTYHYRVHFWNEDGVETISDDYSFVALSETERNKLTELVALTSSIENIPEQYKNDPRWFLLDVDANPTRPWADNTEIPVWAFALVKGEAPNREWLVYVQSSQGDVKGVTVGVPGYGDVLVDGNFKGNFFVINEKNMNLINLVPAVEKTVVNETSTKEFFINTKERNKASGDILIGARKIQATNISLATKFASPTGNGDGTFNNPYGLFTAFESLKEGDILFLRGGNYNIQKNGIRVTRKIGTKENPIIIESYPGEIAILDGKNRTPQDIINNLHPTDHGLYLRETEYVIVRNIEVTGMSNQGIYIKGKNNTIEGCNIHNNFLSGIELANRKFYETPYVDGWNLIVDNIIHANSDADISIQGHEQGDNADGINIASGAFNTVSNNTIYANSDDGIDTWRSNDTLITYNLVYDNGRDKGNGNGIKMGGNTNPNATNGLRAKAFHNISHSNKRDGFQQNSGKDNELSFNTSWNNTGTGFGFSDTTKITNNISSSDARTDYYPERGTRTNNSWNKSNSIQFQSINPLKKTFLLPESDSDFTKIGAFGN